MQLPPDVVLLRHTVATLAYRAGKAVRGAPAEFAAFRVSDRSRTPAEVLAHMGDLLDWALHLADGKKVWHDSSPLEWDEEVARFFEALRRLDERLGSDQAVVGPEKIFQGPVADALTHTGQLTLLRGVFGAPVRGENYYVAKIETGQVGPDQKPAVREF